MRSSNRTTTWIAIALLVVTGIVLAAQAGTPALAQQAPSAGTVGSSSVLHFQDFTDQAPGWKDTCDRQHLEQCEYACMMPGGILDLNCYEDCIYSIC